MTPNKSASIVLVSQHFRCPLAAALWRRQQILIAKQLLVSIDGTDRRTPYR